MGKKNPYAGTQTEKNLEAALPENHRPETNILILLPRLKKRALSKLRLCS